MAFGNGCDNARRHVVVTKGGHREWVVTAPMTHPEPIVTHGGLSYAVGSPYPPGLRFSALRDLISARNLLTLAGWKIRGQHYAAGGGLGADGGGPVNLKVSFWSL
jgi:hypothetical protein